MVAAMANNGLPISVPPPSSTLPSSVPPNYRENGRLYHGFRRGKYMFPCDEEEMDRLDIYHQFFSIARREVLHSAPFTPNYDTGPRILDLGTGTGIWAIDMADKYPTAEVLGIDLSNIQPPKIPPNLSFAQRDIESPWYGMEVDSWDLIHLRMLNGSISSWPETYSKIFRHLKPGYGWIEHVEIDIIPRCNDGTLSPNSRIVEWSRLLLDATARAYRPMAYNTETRRMLDRTGFVDIQEQVIMVPMNPWPADQHWKEIGSWYNLGLTQAFQGLTLGPLTRMSGWEQGDVNALLAAAKRDLCLTKSHMYCNMHIWIARRPAEE